MYQTILTALKNHGKVISTMGAFSTVAASSTFSRHDLESVDTKSARNEELKIPFMNQYMSQFQQGMHQIYNYDMLPFYKQRTQCESSSPALKVLKQTSNDDRSFIKGAKSSSSSWHYVKMGIPARFMNDHAIFGALMKEGNIESYDVYKRVPNLNDATKTYLDDFTSSYVVQNGVRSPTSSISKNATLSIDKTTKTKNKVEYNDENELIVVTVKIGPKMNGHANIIHGGIISLLFDDIMGFAYEAMAMAPTKLENNLHKTEFSIKNSYAFTASLKIDFRSPLWEKHVENEKVIVRIYHDKTVGRKIYLKGQMTNMDGSIVYAEASSLYVWAKPKT